MTLQYLFLRLKGGKGSGNFRHAGRKGHRGGSASTNLGQLMSTSNITPKETVKPGSSINLGGVTESFVSHIEGDGDAIVKPDLPDTSPYRWASNSKAEVAAFEVSEALGYKDLVPITSLREGGTYSGPDGEVRDSSASIQQWVDGGTLGVHVDSLEKVKNLSQLLILDEVIDNGDRHDGNFLVKDNKVIAIDHGTAFSSTYPHAKLFNNRMFNGKRTNIKYRDKDIDPLRKLNSNENLKKSITEKLGVEKWNAMISRANSLVDDYDTNYKNV